MTAAATSLDVIEQRARWSIHRGESYAWLRSLPDACADLVLTDVPYSSGGAFRGDRTKSTDEKYTLTDFQGRRPDFEGDTRDQRGFLAWCSLWMHEALRVTKPGGLFATFIDWRMLPILTDAVQAGGWVWRGVAAWDKTEGARPVIGGMRAQCEFIVWASAGSRGGTDDIREGYPDAPALPGCFRYVVKQADKHHQTGKPTPLMRDLVQLAPPDGLVVDPFAGSFTTGVAAVPMGRRVIGCEISEEYYRISCDRMADVTFTPRAATAAQPSLGGIL